jgi:arginine decarboxylase-like protein
MMPEQANRSRSRRHSEAVPSEPTYSEPPGALEQPTAFGAAPEPWTPQHAARHYHVRGWGAPYFSVNDAGHVQVTPDPQSEH